MKVYQRQWYTKAISENKTLVHDINIKLFLLDTFLIKQLLRRLLQIPGAGAEGHPGCPLLHTHVPELTEHLVKVRILKTIGFVTV